MSTEYTKEQAHGELDRIFCELLPRKGLYQRDEQIKLSHFMLDAMLDSRIALCDAGTGIGKTYAYLVAGILYFHYRKKNGMYKKPIVISTSSIALQNAVMQEYLPLLSEVLLEGKMIHAPVRAVIRKGKRHYACDYRLERRMRETVHMRSSRRRRAALWSLKEDIDMDHAKHLSEYDRDLVCVPETCSCGRETCRYYAHKRRSDARENLFQICNHNLLLADATHRINHRPPILPDSCLVILDEGHKLPEAARQMFGRSLRGEDLRNLMEQMKIERFTRTAEFFTMHTRDLLMLLEDAPEEHVFAEYAAELTMPYKILQGFIARKLGTMSRPLLRKVRNTMETMEALLQYADGGETVCYAAGDETGETVLWATSYHLDIELRKALWTQFKGIVLTSGTMAVGSDFTRFRESVGLWDGGRVVESVSPSPFDYFHNCLLYLPEEPVEYREEDPERYYDWLSEEIANLLDASCGHALVLFPSYELMDAVAVRLREAQLIYPIFTIRRNDGHTLSRFRSSPGAVLLATGSAWEGMDFPGDQVSMLILPKLPFAVPDELRKRQQKEYDSLQDYIRAVVVPEMQIKLRQGFGRAIRTETDTCVVAILDARSVPDGRYHQAMLDALPDMPVTSDMLDVAMFYLEKKSAEYFQEISHD